jgi:UDP-N-acetylmuramate--alanine ligase
MSAMARLLVARGISVSGSDLKRSRTLDDLAAAGVAVYAGHDADQVLAAGRPTAVVASSAIPAWNVEVERARGEGIPVWARAQALAALTEGSRSIAVSGTHGKTTTTSMIAVILERAGLDPTFLIGGDLNESGTGARHGEGPWFVAESDESDGSFLLLAPFIGVVTNVEVDHHDRYASLDDVRAAFASFVGACSPSGAFVLPAGDAELGATARCRIVTFGESGDVHGSVVSFAASHTDLRLRLGTADLPVRLPVPGDHNVANALAAAAACWCAGVPADEIASGLELFRGVERRFQVRGTAAGVTVVDDYAHHPTEVKAILATARAGGARRVVAVFQPHRYSRTAALHADFGASFGDADRIVLTDIYGAGEPPVPGVNGKLVADAVSERLPGRPVAYLPHRADLVSYLLSAVRPGDMVLTMGAGDITAVGEELLGRLGGGR